jgi:hypothetical protein
MWESTPRQENMLFTTWVVVNYAVALDGPN